MRLIVEMEMPQRCFDCPMHDYVSDRSSSLPSKVRPVCNAHHELKPIPKGNERPDWCPIKGELPDEHGDLIDRDKLKRAFCNHCDGRDTMNGEPNCTEPCFDLGLIDCMPVIIAAERKDDGTTAD